MAALGHGSTSNTPFYISPHSVCLFFPCLAYVFFSSSRSETSGFLILIDFESWVASSAFKRFLYSCRCSAKFWCIITHSLFPLAPFPPKPLPPTPPSPFVSPLPSLFYLSRALALPMEMTMMLQQCRAAGKERN